MTLTAIDRNVTEFHTRNTVLRTSFAADLILTLSKSSRNESYVMVEITSTSPISSHVDPRIQIDPVVVHICRLIHF